jgi:hypothetical protein
MYIYIYVCVCTHIHNSYPSSHRCQPMSAHRSAAEMYMYMYICIYMYVKICVWICIYICICIYMYTYVCTHIHNSYPSSHRCQPMTAHRSAADMYVYIICTHIHNSCPSSVGCQTMTARDSTTDKAVCVWVAGKSGVDSFTVWITIICFQNALFEHEMVWLWLPTLCSNSNANSFVYMYIHGVSTQTRVHTQINKPISLKRTH